jgi:hypothetical protein
MSTPSQQDKQQTGLHTPKPLSQPFATVILDGSGNGVASLGPQRVREHWQPTGASVSVATQTNEAQCSIFMGTTMNATTFLGQTATGSSGDTCGFAGGNQDMQTGMKIFAQWKGGDPGSVATVIVNGTYTIGAPS